MVVEQATQSQEEQNGEQKKGLAKAKEAILCALDENGNGELDAEDIIIKSLRVPGVTISRDDYLRKQLKSHYPEEVIELAISQNPMLAGIPVAEIDKLAEESIALERTMVSGISTALGMPGGVAMIATIPADIVQYYGYLLRATQKLLYLYGFPQINLEEEGSKFDDATLNALILCMGVMYGAAGATNGLIKLASALGVGIEKQLIRKPLTKGLVYPIVKHISIKWLNKHMNKEIFAGIVKKAIPIVGGVVGGAVTFVSFQLCCEKLKAVLCDTILSNPDYKPVMQGDIIVEELPNDESGENQE